MWRRRTYRLRSAEKGQGFAPHRLSRIPPGSPGCLLKRYIVCPARKSLRYGVFKLVVSSLELYELQTLVTLRWYAESPSSLLARPEFDLPLPACLLIDESGSVHNPFSAQLTGAFVGHCELYFAVEVSPEDRKLTLTIGEDSVELNLTAPLRPAP